MHWQLLEALCKCTMGECISKGSEDATSYEVSAKNKKFWYKLGI